MGTNSILQVGDLVMLSPSTTMDTSEPWNPLDEVGIVVRTTKGEVRGSPDGVYVSWPSFPLASSIEGIFYYAHDSDLILQTPITKFKTRAEARKAKKGTDLVIVDMGLEEEYRWLLTVKEI